MHNITGSLEDYLEAIYVLQEKGGEVRITDLAASLNLSKPSANRAVSTLKEARLVEHEKYGTITLTPEGEKIGRDVYSRHCILARFFTENLGIDRETAEEDACRIEHVISAETLQKFLEYSETHTPSTKTENT